MKRARRLSLSEIVISNAPTPFSLLVNAGALKLICPIGMATAEPVWLPRLRLPVPTIGYAPFGVSPAATAVPAVPRYCLSWLRLVALIPAIAPSVLHPAAVGAKRLPGLALCPMGLYSYRP